jgi:protein-S-isoprenylcysteine O-methyltransferase Ste14
MALSPDERRFVKHWEEQRKGGKGSWVGVYTFGFFILLYMGFVAFGLFMGLPFIKPVWLLLIGLVSLTGAISLALYWWRRNQQKFRQIVHREIREGQLQEQPSDTANNTSQETVA